VAKLWQKDYTLDEIIEDFTVGIDYELDLSLIASDCLASMAQARQLKKLSLLSEAETACLMKSLGEAFQLAELGTFPISKSDEDCHTALENFLTERCGEAGKKIHTGRSRNDQVITALRVYGRKRLMEIEASIYKTARVFLAFAQTYAGVPMPGRTHMQIAMPSSVGLWSGAWAEELLDLAPLVVMARELLDQGSLGSAASYGGPLPLDRQLTSELLGFSRAQNNVLAVNNSRGRYESIALDALDQIGMTLSKWAQDLILMSLPELGYFRLPKKLCSGSSIMPQKKNPDGLELLRAKSGVLSGYAQTVKNIVRSLPSGYNRDLQDTKEPFFRGLSLSLTSLAVARVTMEGLEVDIPALNAGFTPEIFATDLAFEKVQAGMAFRDAYREVGLHLEELKARSPEASLASRTHLGGTGNLGLDLAQLRLQDAEKKLFSRMAEIHSALSTLAGFPLPGGWNYVRNSDTIRT